MGVVFEIDSLKQELLKLDELANNPELWNDKELAGKTLKRKSNLENKINKYNDIVSRISDQEQYYQLAISENDNSLLDSCSQDIAILEREVSEFEIESLFNGDNDEKNCFIDINAGAGGTDSCDFAMMLLRMYERFANIRKFKSEIISMIDDIDAGIKSATLKISGNFAFGWLRTESGVHRLVRISPFNANDKRQTSFASIWVYPEVDDNFNIEILEKDLRIDTFRASGAGGQHVNKTDSAVRITHLPTNIVVQCQSDRSQIRNRATALNILKSRLYDLELQKQKAQKDVTEASKTDNSWSHQIRSYVLHPYQMVKDLRTGYETANSQAVLDGEITNFIKASLSNNII